MSKILGLDLGTNSIGWAVVEKDTKEIHAGVTTFQQGVNVKQEGSNEEPLNVAKRKARQMRRQVFYKDYRLVKMTEVLAKFGMFPYLKLLDEKQQQKKVVEEIKERFGLTDQELKNHKLNKYKDSYQLNARIAKLLLLMGVTGKTPTANVDFNKLPNTLDEFIEHLVAFIFLDPYRLRSIALKQNITRMEFGRIVYQMGKRRGFKSSRKAKNQEEGDGKMVKKEFKKNNKKKNWEEEVSKLKDKYGEELETLEETDELIIVQYPKSLTDFYDALDKTSKAIIAGKYQTLGNYLYHKNSHEERIRKETKADRSLYIEEFNILWEKHAERLGLNVQSGVQRKKKKQWVEVSLREFLGDPRKGILFYQRPLKSQKHLVAKCSFASKTIRLRDNTGKVLTNEKRQEKTQKVGNSRCLVSHPLYEKFRALQQINNLKVNRTGVWEELCSEERERLLQLFTSGCNESGKVAISKVLDELKVKKEQLKGVAEGDVEAWEEEKENGHEKKKGKKKQTGGSFAGNYTMKKLSDLFGSKWQNFKEFPAQVQESIREKTIKRLGGENVLHNADFKKKNKEERKRIVFEKGKELWNELSKDEQLKRCLETVHEEIWHCFSFYEDVDLLFEKMKFYGLDEGKKEELKKINLKPGYGSLSLKAIRKLLPFMEDGLKYTDAVFLANLDEVFGKEKWLNMPQEERTKIYNDIKNFIRTKQEEKAEQRVKNAVLSAIKREYQKLPKPALDLDETRIIYHTRSKCSKYLKEVKGLNGNGKLESAIATYANELKPLLKNPLSPEFLKTGPVVDQIRNYLKENYNVDENRLECLWHPAKVEYLPPSPDELPEPKFQTLRNPIVKQALYALRNLLKHIETKYGKPDRVHIELARELNDKNKRIAIRKWNKQQEKNRERIKKELERYNIDPKDEAILKYKLWEELQEINGGHVCPYTGETICFDDLFVKNKFQIEHIIPRSRCWSDAEVNLTLCATHFNEFKKNRTPFELKECERTHGYKQEWAYDKILQRVEGWKKKYKQLDAEIEKLSEDLKGKPAGNARDELMQKKHLLTFERNYYRNKYKRFEIENLSKNLNEDDEFLKNLLTDTGYITRLATTYLKSYFGEDKVQPVKGATTTMLREEWNLGNKNRDNHFHHAEDAIIIAFTSLNMYQQLAQHRKEEKEKGALFHPWGLNEFKDKFIKAIQNIAVYDKQRNKKITRYKKTLYQKGKKKRITITSVRGELHQANPYGKLQDNKTFTLRREMNAKVNIGYVPESLKNGWEELGEKPEPKKLTKVKIEGNEKAVSITKLKYSDISKISNPSHRELIVKRIFENGIYPIPQSDELIPEHFFAKPIIELAKAKTSKEIKKCKIGPEKKDTRKISKGASTLLKVNEIPLITDPGIKYAITSRLSNIITNDEEQLIKEMGNEAFQKLSEAIQNETFDYKGKLPDLFFEKGKLYKTAINFGVPIKKVTLRERDENGHRVRKKVEELTFGDIPNLTEPAKSIIEKRLKDIRVKHGNPTDKLPQEFFEEKIYVPVKNVRTHEEANLYEIRKGAYFRFGNTDHAIIYQDVETKKYYVETVPFYFAVNPKKYDENTRLSFFQGVGKKEINNGEFKPEKLREIVKLKNGDYFILNTNAMNADEFQKQVNEQIEKGQNFKLQENLYKVTMISSTSFDIQFRKHYSAKSNEGNINIKSSDKWSELCPIKVRITPTGKISKIETRQTIQAD